MRCAFSIEHSCLDTWFTASDATIPSVSLLGYVGVRFLASDVNEL